MALVIDNDGIKFLEEYKTLCSKYVKSASMTTLNFNDGTTIGMGVALRYALGLISLEQCITGNI